MRPSAAPPPRIVLLGLRGAGKTAVARELARRLGVPAIDVDALVAARAGKPVARVFAEEGEARFRDLEAAALREALVATEAGGVVSPGGGALLRPESRLAIARSGAHVVYLRARPETLAARVAADAASATGRPPLVPGGPLAEARALLSAREPLYQEVAGATVVTDALPVAAVATRVLASTPPPIARDGGGAGLAALVGLALLCLLLLVRAVAPDDLDGFDQAKQGLYVVDAFREGRLLVPLEGGEILPTKPPLLTWLSVATAAVIEQRVGELSTRLPSAGAAILLVLATAWFARRLGALEAVAALVVLATTLHVLKAAWLARTDMLLVALTTVATALVFESYLAFRTGAGFSLTGRSSARQTFLLAALAAGLGTLAKSPVALAVPAAALGLFLALQGSARRVPGSGPLALARALASEGLVFASSLGGKTLVQGAGLALLVPALWFFPAAFVAGEPFVRNLLVKELAGHMAATGEFANAGQPPWYPLQSLAGLFFPWTIVLVAALPGLGGLVRRALRPDASEGDLARLFAVAATAGVLLVCALVRVKRSDHVIPVYPWLALALAAVAIRERRFVVGPRLVGVGSFLAAALLPLALASGLRLVAHPAVRAQLARAELFPMVHHLLASPGLVTVLAILAAAAGVFCWSRERAEALGGVALAASVVGVGFYLGLAPGVTSGKALAVSEFGAYARVHVRDLPVVFLRCPSSVMFFLERSQTATSDPRELAAWLPRGTAVVTDEIGARALLPLRPDLAPACASACYRRRGAVWRLVLLEPRDWVYGAASAGDVWW